MRSKSKIGETALAVIVIIIFAGSILLGLYINYANKKREQELMEGRERTNEEYMAILTDNQADFECVAKTMQQWSEGSIYFYEKGERIDFDDVSSNNPEIENEILTNDDFYNSLLNLYELDEIESIVIAKDAVTFRLIYFPYNYHGGICYGENIEKDSCTHSIDDNWVLQMIPNF